ncbi:uncharacterized protein PV09_00017 [Verruconis gallopava]|uniref:Dienelactone hydrolase domain-containing protein n=1 Tax=Verruconis gallopava TaxID=253628 RepID=A0A0D2AQW5_9PEZI|nr:uncharacterized protein PV09_00017 [Verruconis gallopava]KIW09068.1 hypothetical protein PV09_00017 [Verruconis gallopava]
MSVSSCCLNTFQWDGVPTGRVGSLANNQAYIVGENPTAAILLIHDLLGWTFPNLRLLADHYANEIGVTVYLPDFFGGESLPFEPILNERWQEIDVASFVAKNSREIREPEIFECARELREKYAKIGAIGFCYGGWAVFRLGAATHAPPLVDCISTGHPTWLTKEDIDNVAVPVQLLAPEHDPVFTLELKQHAFQTIIKKSIMFDYQHFPGVHHGCLTRGFEEKDGEREALVQAKSAAVNWFTRFLQGKD